ncbi:hypothetical protein ABW19_dt0207298 [Dactylella cylindrospora]|nr:hypothetical protein ABW19_dt0207298 [Dactylella cylindrospora]
MATDFRDVSSVFSSSASSPLPTKFELLYYPVSEYNPKIPIYRSTLPETDDGLPPSYSDARAAYILQFDPRTQGTVLLSSEGAKVAEISFAKTFEPTVTAKEHEGMETAKLESHRIFRPRGTSFVTSRGYFQWARPLDSRVPVKNRQTMATYELQLTRSPTGNPKPITILPSSGSSTASASNATGERHQVVGRMGINPQDPSLLELEMDEDALSEAMFLGTVTAMLKKSDLKVASRGNLRSSAGMGFRNKPAGSRAGQTSG